MGKVTVGVGHFIPDRGAISHIDLYTVWNGVTGPIATFSEKQDEYDRVSAQPAVYRASWYRSATRLLMLDTTISRLRDEHVDAFHRELQAIYARKNGYAEDFNGFPEAAFAAHLRNIALPPFRRGRCAAHVRQALSAAGVNAQSPASSYAKEWGRYLHGSVSFSSFPSMLTARPAAIFLKRATSPSFRRPHPACRIYAGP